MIYDSVRHECGTSLFWPSLIPLPVLHGDHYEYRWGARGQVSVLRLSDISL